MRINIKTTNTALTPAISDYVSKKLFKVTKLLESDSSAICDMELARTTGHHHKGDIFRAEVHIVGAGKNKYASAEERDLYMAIDRVRDEVLRELTAGKAKRLSYIRRGGAKVKAMIKGLWPWGK